jgi:modulator of FtsH protease HflK
MSNDKTPDGPISDPKPDVKPDAGAGQSDSANQGINDGKWGRDPGNAGAEGSHLSGSDAGRDAGKSDAKDNVTPIRGNTNNGQRGGDQPPDMDELWRDLQKKLGGLFGGGGASNSGRGNNSWNGQNNGGNARGSGHNNGAGGFGGMEPPSAKAAGAGATIAAAVAILIWAGSGFYVVQEGQQGVVTQFGKFKGAESGGLTNAGINWRKPWPIEQHQVVQLTQLRSVEVGRSSAQNASGLKDSSMLTQDENIVDVRFVVQFRLKSAADFLFNNTQPEAAVVLAAESAIREVVGKSTMNVVLNEKRESIAGDIVKGTQAQLDLYKAGIEVASVNIQNVQPPEQVQAAFDDALKAGQDGDRAKNEGQAYFNEVVPRAEGRASRLKEEAIGYKARVVAQAQGDADRFKSVLVEYQKAPQVTRDRMYIDTMQQIFTNTTKIMVDSRSGNNLLSLPLDRLLQLNAGQGTATVQSPVSEPTPAAAPAAAPVVDPRARDDGRTRSRDGR